MKYFILLILICLGGSQAEDLVDMDEMIFDLYVFEENYEGFTNIFHSSEKFSTLPINVIVSEKTMSINTVNTFGGLLFAESNLKEKFPYTTGYLKRIDQVKYEYSNVVYYLFVNHKQRIAEQNAQQVQQVQQEIE